MRRVAVLAFPVIFFAACDSVGPEPTRFRGPALGSPSFQVSNTGVTIIDLGPPDGSGLAGQGLSVNEAGHVVGTILDFGAGVGAFLWADGVMTRIDNIEPSAINDDGLIAGGCSSHACLWNNGVTTDLGTLGGDASMARDLNNAGQVVGISKTSAGEWHGFLWADGVMTDLGSIEPRAINERGQIAGFCPAFGFPMRACLWENGVITELGTLGGAWSRAFDINNVGQVVGISLTSTGQTHAFLWANGVMTDLGHLGRDHSEARAINDAGQVVGFGCIDGCEAWHGGLSNTGTVWHGFLWTNGVMTDLGTLGGHQNRPDWSIPEDINEAGLIAGSSYTGVALDDDDATGHAVVWTPGPGNTAPAVSAGPDQQVGVGQAVSLTFTFPDATPEGPWTWYVAWGDYPDQNSEFMATSAGTATTPNDPITVTHTYAVEGEYTVYVRVTDGNGGVGLAKVIVTVSTAPAPATISHTLLAAGTNTVNQKIYTTAPISPAPNTLVTVAVLGHSSLGIPPSPTLSGGGMTAWEIVATTTFDTGTSPRRRLTIFRGMSTAPGSGALTITSSMTLSHCQWIVSQWGGVETGGMNGAGAIRQTGSTRGDAVSGLTVPLAAFGHPNNVGYGVFGVRSNLPAVTPGAGFTEISEQPSGEGTPGDLEAEWATNRNTINATWTNLNGGALGVEIKAAAKGGPVPDASRSTVSAAPTSITAGAGSSTISVTVKDAGGNPIRGVRVVLSATGSGNTLTQPASLTDASGVATGTLSSTVAGTKTVSATADGTSIVQTAVVTVNPGPVSPSQSTVTAAPVWITSGSETSTITVTVKDAHGNPITGATVVLEATGSEKGLTQPAGPTDANGVATGTVSSTVEETKRVWATANGTPLNQIATVTVTAPPVSGKITQTLLTAGNNTVNQKVYTTAAIAPAPNTLVTVAVLEHSSLGTPPSPTLSGGGMTAWEIVATTTFDTGTSPRRRLTIFRAMSTAPGSGALTITSSMTLSHCQWIVSQWDGVETSRVNGAGAIGQTGSSRGEAVTRLTVSLAPFGSPNNVAYGVFGVASQTLVVTPGAGFTEISEQPSGESTPGDLQAEWQTNDPTIDATWTSRNAGGLGVEIVGATAGGGNWTTAASMPTARSGLGAAAVNGILYAVGGEGNNGILATVEAYDPATNTWTTKAPMPTARYGLGVAAVNGILYAVGGLAVDKKTLLTTVEAYDPATNTWTTKAPMPTARGDLGVVGLNGILYAVGGANFGTLATVEAYDPATNTWTTKAPMPTGRSGFDLAEINGVLYVAGGEDRGTHPTIVEAYDPATNTWTTKAPMPTARTLLGVAAVNGILYAVGGAVGSVVPTVEAYDPATDTWTTKAPMPGARWDFGVGVINGILYAVGGDDEFNTLATVQAYQP
jgi:probable HAF family extracellular repeat protein